MLGRSRSQIRSRSRHHHRRLRGAAAGAAIITHGSVEPQPVPGPHQNQTAPQRCQKVSKMIPANYRVSSDRINHRYMLLFANRNYISAPSVSILLKYYLQIIII